VAYDSQLRARRARVHADVARALVASDKERLAERAGLVAHHFEAAGETLEAARWYARAAEWAGINAPAEASVPARVPALPERAIGSAGRFRQP